MVAALGFGPSVDRGVAGRHDYNDVEVSGQLIDHLGEFADVDGVEGLAQPEAQVEDADAMVLV